LTIPYHKFVNWSITKPLRAIDLNGRFLSEACDQSDLKMWCINAFVIELTVYYILFFNIYCYNIIRKSSYDLSVKQRKKE